MKIVIRQISGLGNQMFQYAAGRYYARRHNATMRVATDPPSKATSHGFPRPFLLSHFAIEVQCNELSPFEQFLLLTKRRRLQPIAKISTAVLKHGLHLQIVMEEKHQRHRFQPDLSVASKTQTIYLVGYWQVHQIAEAMATDLRREFSFREAPTGRNAELLRMIQNSSTPVSLHIRRGDYTLAVEGHVALSMDYYMQAIKIIKESTNNPFFFVFSDDIAFAKRTLSSDISAVFVDHNDSFSAHEDLRLMSSCRHHIIANSSFSWWGAWLNPHADRIVVAPRNWMVGSCPNYDDLFPPDWRVA